MPSEGREHRIHTWERWDSMGDYGWKCLVCGANTDEEPAVTVTPLSPGRQQASPLVPCQSDPQQPCGCRRGGRGGTACRTLLHKAGLLHREAGHDGSEYRCQPCLWAAAAYWKEQRDA